MYGTVRTVVWEDGGCEPPSYPIGDGADLAHSPLRNAAIDSEDETLPLVGVVLDCKCLIYIDLGLRIRSRQSIS